MNEAITINVPCDLLRILQIAYDAQGIALEDRIIELLYMEFNGILFNSEALNAIHDYNSPLLLLCDKLREIESQN
jgi:hypothetical protein